MDSRSEGPLKYPPYVCPFVLLSVCIFVWSLSPRLLKFSNFWCKIKVSSNLRSDRAQFFEKIDPLKSPKWAQNKVVQDLWKTNTWNFSDISDEVTVTQILKVGLDEFLEKILFWGFWTKKSHNRPKCGFPSFMKNWCWEYFWFSAKSYCSIKLKLELSRFFGKNLALRFLGQKGPNMCPKWGFSGIIKSQSMELF